MSVSLSVFEHLGEGLYSNVPAVLSEVVANAWDADALHVDIEIDIKEGRIVISDDGVGMTLDDINGKYLKIGYKKREQPDFDARTPLGRPPMGRKGIGKLSVFAIANTVEIYTSKDGDSHAFRLSSSEIKTKTKGGTNEIYHPKKLTPANSDSASGTKIILSDLRKRINTTEFNLRRRLARRFTIIGDNRFVVRINGDPISAQDRDYYRFFEYVWHFDMDDEDVAVTFPNRKNDTKESCSFGENIERRISGWIGTVARQDQIQEDTAGITIFSRGKLVHENLLKDMKQGGIWTKYAIGEIDAEFLDDDNSDDIITSARQSLNENDERYIELKTFLEDGVIKRIATNWQVLRRKHGAQKTLEDRPNIKRWYDQLGDDQKRIAKSFFGKIESREDLNERDKRDLFKGTIIAFQHLDANRQLNLLQAINSPKDFQLLAKFFGTAQNLERIHYYSVAKLRVEAIKKFQNLVDTNQKEKVLQEHVFSELWLLDPSWARAATNKRIEQTVKREFDAIEAKLSDEERDGRIDIRYTCVTGRHVIVELKRSETPVPVLHLIDQLAKYKSAITKCLKTQDAEYEEMTTLVVSITGSPPIHRYMTDDEIAQTLRNQRIKCLTYDQLISRALISHDDYLEAEKTVSEFVSLIEDINEDFEV